LTDDIHGSPHQLRRHGGSDTRGGISHRHSRRLGEPQFEKGSPDVTFCDFKRGHVERPRGDGAHEGSAEAFVEASETLVAHNGAGHVEAGEARGGNLLARLQHDHGVEREGNAGE